MGTLGGSDAGNGPSDGNGFSDGDEPTADNKPSAGKSSAGNGFSAGELSWLPPDWGSIVLPDDLSELADEVVRVRRELRREARRGRRARLLRRLLGDEPAGWLPALIAILVVLGLLAGLFRFGYSGGRNTGGRQPSGTPTAVAPTPREIPALDLVDARGRTVAIRSLLPAVVLLTEGCYCADLIRATTRAAPTGVTVVLVARTVPVPPPGAAVGGTSPRPLADPAGELRSLLGLTGPAARPGVLIADRRATVTLALATVTTVDEFRTALAALS